MHCPRRCIHFPGDADTLLEAAIPVAPEVVASVAPKVVAPVAPEVPEVIVPVPDDLGVQNLLFGGSSYDVCFFMWIR